MDSGRRVVGAVLAGGRSRRMGTTKALVSVDGRAMAARVIDALRSGGCDPIVVVGGDPDELHPLGVPVWRDRHPGAGPLGGLVELLRRSGDEFPEASALAVVACDLPWLEGGVIDRLVTALQGAPDAEVCVARTDRPEPLCAVWRPTATERVSAAFESGTRAMHQLLDTLRVVSVEIDAATLRNVNAPEDLQQ